ncbi:MAG: carboxymuconolactone decarboxylase family protein [Deltaproteobacteria bacterium]|jgi:4-carboxymuconolactone decarboxylase|nr:carboxymuconolactone decarboxylase family protein [Deltaproteobacteria bacterium]
MSDAERRELIGQIKNTLTIPDEIADDFGGLVADAVMGGVWSRSGLSPRERSLITIAALTALDRPHELEIHLGMGLSNGLEKKEICEVIMHMAIYGGFPVAVEGMRIAKEVFEKDA